MGFSGVRALILLVVLVVLALAVTQLDFPGWILPVGLILAGTILRSSEKKASAT
jgi:hypothetical protein